MHTLLRKLLRFSVLLWALSALCASSFAQFANFITRSSDQLMDGNTAYRFMGAEAFNAHYLHDNYTSTWRVPTASEQDDAFATMQGMGQTVNRLYALSVRESGESTSIPRHVDAAGSFDETVFRGLDKAVQTAANHNVRLIISLIDGQGNWGGPADYAAFEGQSASAFWTNTAVMNDFKKTISYILNRTNYYTGVQYKNDKTVLCWQLGNEMSSGDATTTYTWMSTMAAYVKSIDSNHLVCSGHYVREEGIPSQYLSDPNIDIIDAHLYGYHNYSDGITGRLSDLDKLTATHRVLMVGEFGADSTTNLKNLMTQIIDTPSVAGGQLWALSFHTSTGNYFESGSGISWDGTYFEYYRWPGYSPSGDSYAESTVLSALSAAAFKIRNVTAPSLPIPAAPTLLAIAHASEITWTGTANASSYSVARATQTSGPWTKVDTGITDDRYQTSPTYSDTTGTAGQSYYYRVSAQNSSGSSGASNIVGPVTYNVVNLAPSATLNVDSINGSNTPDLAVDGITNTDASRWVSTNAETAHYFQLSWTSAQTVHSVKLWTGQPSEPQRQLATFTLDYWDGSEWVTCGKPEPLNLEDVHYGRYNWWAFSTPLSTTRMRVHISKGSASDDYARIGEIEVF